MDSGTLRGARECEFYGASGGSDPEPALRSWGRSSPFTTPRHETLDLRRGNRPASGPRAGSRGVEIRTQAGLATNIRRRLLGRAANLRADPLSGAWN